MYGLPVGGEWGSMFSDLLRVPHAEGALVALPPGVTPADAASVSDNLPAAWEVTVPHLADYPEAQVLIMGGCGSIALYAVACAAAADASRIDYLDSDPDRDSSSHNASAPKQSRDRRPRRWMAST